MNRDRRTLQFESLDEVMPEVERLMKGHTTVGNWSLSRICGHLAATMRLALAMPATTRHDPSLLFSPEDKARVFEAGRLPEGLAMPPALENPEPLTEQEAAGQLREAIAAFKASPGPAAPHRYFGQLSKEEWDRLNRVHCAHHLSFVLTKP